MKLTILLFAIYWYGFSEGAADPNLQKKLGLVPKKPIKEHNTNHLTPKRAPAPASEIAEFPPVKEVTEEEAASNHGLAFVRGKHSSSLDQFYQRYSHAFDETYPPPHEIIKKHPKPDRSPYTPEENHHLHSKRCISLQAGAAKDNYVNNRFISSLNNVKTGGNDNIPSTDMMLVQTSCFGISSLGNYLGEYFESVMCSYFSGLHFVSVSRIWEPAEKDFVHPFFSKLPYLIEHPAPEKNADAAKKKVEEYCRCGGNCHEHTFSLWTRGVHIIKPLLNEALEYQYSQMLLKTNNYTTVQTSDHSNIPSQDEELPLIPDVAIHYRCGDNFVGHYGFLPFRAYGHLLQSDYREGKIKTIYILAEKRDRGISAHKKAFMETCDQIFPALFHYFNATFPHATILIRRGDDPYLDLIRLAKAKITICSVSTFCLWPALVQGKNAYYPQTKLIVRGNTHIDLGFHWITHPPVLLGQHHAYGNAQHLIRLLEAKNELNDTVSTRRN